MVDSRLPVQALDRSPGHHTPISVFLIVAKVETENELARLIGERPGLTLAGGCIGINEAHRQLASIRPMVCVLDVEMGSVNFSRALSILSRQATATSVVAVGRRHLIDELRPGLYPGIHSVYEFNETNRGFAAAIEAANFRSKRFTRVEAQEQPPTDSEPLADAYAGSTAGTQWLREVKDQDLRILRGLARGLTNAQIGASLYLSEATIKSHIAALMRKVGVDNRVQLALAAARAGLLTT